MRHGTRRNARHLTLFEVIRQASDTGAPPPYYAPRGDLFREANELQRAATAGAGERSQESWRSGVYSTLGMDSLHLRAKGFQGPLETLRRRVRRSVRDEFDLYLKGYLHVKGGSIKERYESLMCNIKNEIDEIRTDLHYTNESYYKLHDRTKDAFERLGRARTNISELPGLLMEISGLYRALDIAKSPPLPREVAIQRTQEALERAERRARDARVLKSRTQLRELAGEYHSDDDVRYFRSWINLDSIVSLLADDLKGYAGAEPLWQAIPSVNQLMKDYQISRHNAGRILAAYGVSLRAGGTGTPISEICSAEQDQPKCDIPPVPESRPLRAATRSRRAEPKSLGSR